MPDDGKTLKQQLNGWFDQLKTDRQTYENYFEDVKDYILPERGRFIRSVTEDQAKDGERKDQKIINSVATSALKIMANGMQSGLTSKARPWLNLTSPDIAVSKLPHVREYLKIVTDVLMQVYAGSNIYNALLTDYIELGGFGTAAQTIYEHPTKVLFAKTYTAGQYWVSYDAYNELDAFFNTMFYSVKQMVEIFGLEKCSQSVQDKWRNKSYEDQIQVIEAIIKNPKSLGLRVPNGMPVADIHYEATSSEGDEKLLKIQGFRSFPTQAPRWDVVSNDSYGYSVSKDVIGDIKGIQKMERDSLQGIAKVVNPPLQGPPEMERKGINASPGGFNAVAQYQQNGPAITPLYGVNPDIQSIEFKIGQYEQRIRAAYFNDLFMTIRSQDANRRTMTATEVASRNDEAFLILGPVLESIQYELLNPMIMRSIQILFSAGMIPETPDEIIQSGFDFEYTSILSQAQKAVSTARIENTMGFVGRMAGVFPEIRKAVDPYKAIEEFDIAVGGIPGIIKPREEYESALAEESKMLQAQQQAEIGKTVSEGAKNMSDTDPARIQESIAAATGGVF